MSPPPPPRACLVDARTLGAVRHLAILMMLTINRRSKVVELRNRIRPDRLGTFLPIRRTHFPVFILWSIPHPISIHKRATTTTHGKLKRLHEANRLVDGPSNGQVVHRDLPQHTLGIDQVARTEGDALVLDQTPVLARYAHVAVSQQRDAQVWAEPALGARLLRPGVMGVLRVGRDGCVAWVHACLGTVGVGV